MAMETLHVERDAPLSGVWTITLNRPESRNAMSLQMVRELRSVLAEAQASADARVLVLRGAGGHFCSGGDIRDMAAALGREAGAPGALAEVNAAFGQFFRALKGLHGNGLFAGLKGVVAGAIPFATRSALFEGAVSVIVNGYYLATGREGIGTFGGNVVGDSLAGLAGGAGAAVGGAIAMAVLPFGGTMGLILTALAGVFGYGFASNALRSTSLYNNIVGGVRNALGGY